MYIGVCELAEQLGVAHRTLYDWVAKEWVKPDLRSPALLFRTTRVGEIRNQLQANRGYRWVGPK